MSEPTPPPSFPPPPEPGSVPPPPPYAQGYAPGPPAAPPVYGVAAPLPLRPEEERQWAMLAHLGYLLSLAVWLLAIIAPILVLTTYRDRSRFVVDQAKEAINFQITVIIVTVVGGIAAVVATIVTLGAAFIVVAPLAAAYAIFTIVIAIVAAVHANRGEPYRYPAILRLVS